MGRYEQRQYNFRAQHGYNNRGAGIYDEISYDATIVNNIVTGNDMPSAPGRTRGSRIWMVCRYPAPGIGSAKSFIADYHL